MCLTKLSYIDHSYKFKGNVQQKYCHYVVHDINFHATIHHSSSHDPPIVAKII